VFATNYFRNLFAITLFSSGLFLPEKAVAQITPDQTLGEESSVVVPNQEIRGIDSDRVEGGARRNSNLFHSFQKFNVESGRGVYFSNPDGIANILTRVTGQEISNINGTLGALGNANLFLINPNGIVFGPGARLDVQGSFVGSTADSILFENYEFSATNPNAPPLLTINVPTGLQMGNNPGEIVVRSRPSPLTEAEFNESADTGQSLETAEPVNDENSPIPSEINGELSDNNDEI